MLSGIIEKPWGREVVWAHVEGKYAGKFLYVNAGQRLSTQYHERKHESMVLISGDAAVHLITKEGHVIHPLVDGPIDIPPKTVHWVETLHGAQICEVSTDDLADVVRLFDPYGRA